MKPEATVKWYVSNTPQQYNILELGHTCEEGYECYTTIDKAWATLTELQRIATEWLAQDGLMMLIIKLTDDR